MLDKTNIEEAVTKFQAYRVIVTDTKDLTYAKQGDMVSSEAIFYFNLYLDLYIFLLEYSLTWFDDTDTYREDDAPLTIEDINDIIDRGNELVTVLIQTPLNV